MLSLSVCVMAAPTAVPQVRIDAILKYVNDDFVSLLDVRQARLLKLVDLSGSPTDNDVAMRIVERRLELADIARTAPKPVTPQALQQRHADWEASVGGAAKVPDLLRQAGMSEQDLDNWLRDDVRLQMYVDDVFLPRATPSRSEMLEYYQSNIAKYTKDGAVQTFDAVGADVRRELRAANLAALVKSWADSLVRRAVVR